MKKRYRLLISILLISILALIRLYGPSIFYDPFIDYFNGAYLTDQFPEFDTTLLFTSLSLRYLVNSIISIAVIYTIFLNKDGLKFSLIFYFIGFLVLSFFYYFHLKMEFNSGYLVAFYLRRILIHPVFLLILLPTFYYQKKIKK